MTTLDDKAETPENVAHSIEDAAEKAAQYRVRSLELDPAEEVGTDQFPQYGDWLPAVILRDGLESGEGEVWVECPRGLARELVGAEVEEGDVFEVENVSKTTGGEWDVSVQVDG